MKRVFAAAALVAVLIVSACSGGNATAHGTGSVHHGPATITIKDFGYTGDLVVEPGAHVTVVNKDSVAHTLTDKANGMFDTGAISGGSTGSFVAPMNPGKYPFGCKLHPEMTGVLTVANR